MESRQPVLCSNCQNAVDIPPAHLFHDLEPRFLRGDYRPSETERYQLQSMIEEGERQMKQYDEEISVMRQRLEQLEKTKEGVEMKAMRCHAALSVQRRVPTEIWEMIFSILCLSLHEYSFNIEYYTVGSRLLGLAATLISQVCSQWNVVAKRIPAIWSSYNFDVGPPPCDIAIPLRTYLSNSKDFPLKIRFKGKPAVRITPRTVAARNILYKQIYRSREFDLSSLFEHSEIWTGWRWLRENLEKAPNLKKITIWKPPNPEYNVLFPQITVLEVNGIFSSSDVTNFLHLARRSERLTDLSLDIVDLCLSGDAPFPEATMPHLRNLFIYAHDNDGSTSFSSVFASLIMPSLETCRFNCVEWPEVPSLLTMARRASTSLKSLTLTTNPQEGMGSLRGVQLFEILQVASQLTHFKLWVRIDEKGTTAMCNRSRLSANEIISTFLTRLRNRSDDFLPNLRFLSVTIPDVTLDAQLVELALEAVMARRATRYPLMDLCVVRLGRGVQDELDFAFEPGHLQRVKDLRGNGIRVVVEERILDIGDEEEFEVDENEDDEYEDGSETGLE